jgi:D-glycero-D-manno-heptose 1,7-bisphosphate phosphatase
MAAVEHRAVFLDRDGVINEPIVRDNRPYPPAGVEEFFIYPEVAGACRRLREAGFLLVVVTNQPDVGRGTQLREVVESIHGRMVTELPIDRVEVCYDPGGSTPPSPFRKPAPGMILKAARELSINLSESYMVGDRWRDVDCGHAAGCTTVFIDRGYSEELRQKPHFKAGNLAEAADIILEHAKK